MNQDYGLHWFRRDLRVAGNEVLHENRKRHRGKVVGVFCFDKKFLSRSDFSVNRFQFFIETLIALQEELRDIGSDLLFMDESPRYAFPRLLDLLEKKQGHLPCLITWNRDYEPFSLERDEVMKKIFQQRSIPVLTGRDHLLVEPEELVKDNKGSKKAGEQNWYKIYSPFARRWLENFQKSEIQKRINIQKKGLEYLKKRSLGKTEKLFNLNWNFLLKKTGNYRKILEDYQRKNGQRVTVSIPKAGSIAAFSEMKNFFKRLDEYGGQRDFPSVRGTSGLSLFLKNGSLTVSQIIAFYDLKPYARKENSRDVFFSELIWREFYYHILYHRPDVEFQSFLPQYRNLNWENNEKYFKAWKEGKTGFPIIDAGMRQLNRTGWMHNRVRMIVASFLTKDLLIDWRWGEKYFMEVLLDGDLAANNGGWQWAASTGCDPQPYFRIFNPWLQSRKFDPMGLYIKTHVDELKRVDSKDLHKPVKHTGYMKPIVDHKVQREKALALYK